MAYHIPFEARRKNRPMYIGFDQPAPRRRSDWNCWGFWGFLMSIGSFATAGFASPLAFLVSANGMRKSKGRRKLAATGTLFSLAGIALASSIVYDVATEGHRMAEARQHRASARQTAIEVADAKLQILDAKKELRRFREDNSGLPTGIDGNMLLVKYADPWGESLRFEPEQDQATIRSAGPDGKFNSNDDVVSSIKGKTTDSRIEL